MADHAAPLEILARIEARRVDEGHDRQVERVAERHEPRRLLRCRDVERAGEGQRLVGDDADRKPADRGERGDHIGRPAAAQLQQFAVVADRPDHVADVVAARRGLRHQQPGLWSLTVGRIIGRQPARFLVVVLRQVGEQLGDHVDGRLEIGSDEARRAGVAGVRCRSAELFVVDPHAGELGHHRRTGDERVRVHGHHDEVGDPQQQRRARKLPGPRPP